VNAARAHRARARRAAPAADPGPPAQLHLFVIAVRDIVMCPDMVMPIVVGRPQSLRALELAALGDKTVFLATQKAFDEDEPGPDGLYKTGCICRILQTARQNDGTVKVLMEGTARGYMQTCVKEQQAWRAGVERIEISAHLAPAKAEAAMRATVSLFEEYVRKNPKMPDDALQITLGISDPAKLFHLIVGHMTCRPEVKIELLDESDLPIAYLELCRVLSNEIELLNLEHRIYGEVRKQIDEQQKSYFLNEQIKAIERELGRKGFDEIRTYEKKLKQARMPAAVHAVAHTELERLERMPPFSPEGTVIRNYLDWLIAIPWQKRTEDDLDIAHARKVLERTHYGLKEPKQRLLEYLAVRTLHARSSTARRRRGAAHDSGTHSTVLCLVGPPGVGKTSLARAIADALGRRFVRISLGGVRDEAEIRGHRRTYIGALPGRIIQGLKKAGTRNPVMLLDEVDKLYSDLRGDPASALLEVLDPEQNRAFNDHYLEVDVDLSEVMFICTANVQDAIHPTLRDRMEKIELSSYTESEKMHIARSFLIEKQRRAAAIPGRVSFDDDALHALIRQYTHEAGVRELDRLLAQIMRKMAMELVSVTQPVRRGARAITAAEARRYLGTPKHRPDTSLPVPVAGMSIGLAWTDTGGEILKVEVTVLEGKGDLMLTGQLGDVMQESARAALTFVRAQRSALKLPRLFFARHDLHIHVPEGAIPKDGPSAGITIATALYSALSRRPVRHKLAMTGEITLGGAVLLVGGLKEKLLAAHRAGITDVIIPERNLADLDDVPDEVRAALRIHTVETMYDVVQLAFAKEQPHVSHARSSR